MNKNELKIKIVENLKLIFDPELPVNIYDLGLIYKIELEVKDNYMYCEIEMTLTSPSCPVSDSLLSQVQYAALNLEEIDEVNVDLVFEPMWTNEKITSEGKDILMMSGII
ncbi:MAG: iron-sulfur cluster assembly protein [Campylobacterales bacterium]|nr:iron-sulfur cluster assembly protein [Campylobacterales bacterium]